MPHAIPAQSADMVVPQAPSAAPPALPALQAPRALEAPPALPARPAHPAWPVTPAWPAEPAAPAIAAVPPTPAKVWTTAPPAQEVWSTQASLRDLVFSDGFQIASFLLVFPFAIALARRVWSRGGPRPT